MSRADEVATIFFFVVFIGAVIGFAPFLGFDSRCLAEFRYLIGQRAGVSGSRETRIPTPTGPDRVIGLRMLNRRSPDGRKHLHGGTFRVHLDP